MPFHTTTATSYQQKCLKHGLSKVKEGYVWLFITFFLVFVTLHNLLYPSQETESKVTEVPKPPPRKSRVRRRRSVSISTTDTLDDILEDLDSWSLSSSPVSEAGADKMTTKNAASFDPREEPSLDALLAELDSARDPHPILKRTPPMRSLR